MKKCCKNCDFYTKAEELGERWISKGVWEKCEDECKKLFDSLEFLIDDPAHAIVSIYPTENFLCVHYKERSKK